MNLLSKKGVFLEFLEQPLLKNLSKEMTKEFGKGFTLTNLKYMRRFYLTFPKSHALSDQLSWTHYRLLMRVENENARNFYIEETIKKYIVFFMNVGKIFLEGSHGKENRNRSKLF